MWTKPRLKAKLKEGKMRVTWNKSVNTTVNTPEPTVTAIVTLKEDLIPEDKRRANPPVATEYRIGAWDCENNVWHVLGVPVTRVVSVEEVTD